MKKNRTASMALLLTFGLQSVGFADYAAVAMPPGTPRSGDVVGSPFRVPPYFPPASPSSEPAGAEPATPLAALTAASRMASMVAASSLQEDGLVQASTSAEACAQSLANRTTPVSRTSRTELWPPNHSLVDVGYAPGIAPACEGLVGVTLAVWADEPQESPTGDGTHSPDAHLDGADLFLRSERKGDADGRVYLVITRATLATGESNHSCSTVVVSHSATKALQSSVRAQAAAALSHCNAQGGAPDDFVKLIEGEIVHPNAAPVVNAGPDQSIDIGTPASLDGTVEDDGLPVNQVTVAWREVSGPGTVTFSHPASPDTQATFSAAGEYVLELSASDTRLSAADTVTVTVGAANLAPEVTIDPVDDITLPTRTVTLTGHVSDDGRPGPLTIGWRQVNGTGVIFSSPTTEVTDATFPGAGTYELELSATDSDLSDAATVTITVREQLPPVLTVNAVPVVEGQDGTVGAEVHLTLSRVTSDVVTVGYMTQDGTATAPCDYRTRYGIATIEPGDTSALIVVPVAGDLALEADESLTLRLEVTGAELALKERALQILNDDQSNGAPVLSSVRTPADGATGVGTSPVLGWSANDPDGDALTHDVYLGTSVATTGQSWSAACPAAATAPVQEGAAAYDEVSDRLFVIGGQTSLGVSSGVSILANAAAAAGHPTWFSPTISGSALPGRTAAAAAFDSSMGRVIVTGGCTAGCATALADAWVLTDALGANPTWAPLPDAPQARAGHVAAFDAASNRLIVFGGREGAGGTDLADVWLLKDANGVGTPAWEALQTSGTGPEPRFAAAGAYDAASNRLIVFGGRNRDDRAFSDVWVLTHANGLGGPSEWILVTPAGARPAARSGHSVGFDPSTQRLLVFGGTTAGAESGLNFVFGDTWLLTDANGLGRAAWVRLDGGAGPLGRLGAAAGFSSALNRLVITQGANPKLPGGPYGDLWVLENAAGTLPLVAKDQLEASFAAEGLQAGTRYFWRTVTRDAHGAIAANRMWSFVPNRGPAVDAGIDQTVTYPATSTTLAGTVVDDGLPVGGSVTSEWTQVSGPAGGASIADPTSVVTPVSFAQPGTYVFRLTASDTLAEAFDETTVVVTGRQVAGRTYTTDADFDEGQYALVGHAISDQLALRDDASLPPYIWVAVSTKGTIVKIDTRDGAIKGEYWTSPDGQPRDPSRTTVDRNGNVWAANRASNSIVHIGLRENGQCVDRNGNGAIDTSSGQNDIRPWANAGGVDSNGGVTTAADECVLHFTRISSAGTRHITVNAQNDVWVSGTGQQSFTFTGGRTFDLVDGTTGQIKRQEPSVAYGGYGGVIDGNGVIWSARPLLRWDTAKLLTGPNGGNWTGTDHSVMDTYGICLDRSSGAVWVTALNGGIIRKLAPDGSTLGVFSHGFENAQGCMVDRKGDVWVAHSVVNGGHTVGHLTSDGTYLGSVPVGSGPTGVALDVAGKIWATNYFSQTVSRIDPALGPIGLDGVTPVGAVDLTTTGLQGGPYNYSDMTGSSLGTAASGSWSVVFDSAIETADWGVVDWNESTCGAGSITVTAASSVDNVVFSSPALITRGQAPAVPAGRYLRVVAAFSKGASGPSPILYDLTVGTVGFSAFTPSAPNQAPAVSSGPDQTVAISDEAILAGSACDDGKPDGTYLTSEWSVVSGPAPVTFANAASPDTRARFGAAGTYRLQLTARDSLLEATDTVDVNAVAPTCATTPSGIKAWFRAEGNYVDIVGGVALTPQGATGFGAGVAGQAFTFSGSGVLSGPVVPALQSNSFTIETWIKRADDAYRPIVDFGSGSPVAYGVHLWINLREGNPTPGALYANIVDANGRAHLITSHAGAVPLAVWTHVAVTYDQATGTGALFVNGNRIAARTLGVFTPQLSLPLKIGARLSDGQERFNGSIDEVSIYARALPTADIARIARAGSLAKCGELNAPPAVDAGADQDLVVPVLQTTLTGTVTDDGLPSGVLTQQWSTVGGPGTVTFGSPSAESTSVQFSGPGVYVLQLVASDSAETSLDTVTVTIRERSDLIVTAVDATGVTTDGQTLAATGNLSATLANVGAGDTGKSFEITFFEDRNGNATYEAGVDTLLGTASAAALAAGAQVPLTAQVTGTLLFAGSVLHAFVDSGNVVTESNETNNYGSSSAVCAVPSPPLPFAAQLEWSWEGSAEEPTAANVTMAPAVADLNGDGVPEVIFTAGRTEANQTGNLRAVRGSDGSPVFTVTNPALLLNPFASLTVGDLDGDGRPEILAVGASNDRILAFEHDGTLEWQSPRMEFTGMSGPAVADLDADGSPEIIVGRQVLNSDGTLRWTGAAGSGRARIDWGYGSFPVIADLDLDGVPEVLGGHTAYRRDGTILWNAGAAGIPDGHPAVGNFDLDAHPEIVLVAHGRLRMLEHDGSLKWGPVTLAGTTFGGAPLVADVDGDGKPEIGVAGRSAYTVFSGTGVPMWSMPTQDFTSETTGASVFDFQGDGRPEIVYTDELKLRVFDGATGAILFEHDLGSGTGLEYPVVADVDGDGRAEIVATADNIRSASARQGLFVFGSANGEWASARRIWNQHSYHVTNVNDDGTIPSVEQNSWQVTNTYRGQRSSTECETALPDLRPSYVRSSGAPAATVTARIGNGGAAATGPGVIVSFYIGQPGAGGTLLGTAQTAATIAPGGFEDVSFTLAAGAKVTRLWVVADDDGTGEGARPESDETNNTYDSGLSIGFAPDLKIASVDASSVSTDGQTLAVQGNVTVSLQNVGDAPVGGFQVTVFEDRNGNGTYEGGDDVTLGVADAAGLAVGGSAPLTVPVAGTVRFAGNTVHAFADSANVVPESDETNNYATSAICSAAPPAAPFSARVKWTWTPSTEPSAADVVVAPVVADLDSDGRTEVVFPSYYQPGGGLGGFLRVTDGETGATRFTGPVPVRADGSIAVADLDDPPNGSLEIIAVVPSGDRVLALESDGSLRWTSPVLETIGNGTLAVANLDGIGGPEIVVGRQALSSVGALLWTGTGGRGLNRNTAGYGPVSLIADVNMDGSLDVVAGNTAYSATGAVLWQVALTDGYNAVGNFDGDPFPEIVLVSRGAVSLLEHDGTVKWGPKMIESAAFGGPPTVADLDGDGTPEIGVAFKSGYLALEADSSELWWVPVQDFSSHVTGSSVFDFNADGEVEVVYADEKRLRVFRGRDGTILYDVPNSSGTELELPVVADIDGNGQADILVAGNRWAESSTGMGLRAFESASMPWANTRRIWNQHTYHVGNVNDDGTIPAREANSWQGHNSYRQQRLPVGCTFALPDLRPSYVRTDVATPATVTARVGNGGIAATGPGVAMSFYNAQPGAGGVLLGTSQTTSTLAPGDFEDVSFTLAAGAVAKPIWVVADDNGTGQGDRPESDETNNAYNSRIFITAVPNEAPIVDAGPDLTIELPVNSAALSGTVDDDDEPLGTLTYMWTAVQAAGAVTFSDPTSRTTSVTFASAGTYVLQLTADDGDRTGSDTVTVVVAAQNALPVVSAGPDLNTTTSPVALNGSVTDDGLPAGSALALTWSQLDGPPGVTFSAPNSAVTSVTLPSGGTYHFLLTASDGRTPVSDSVEVIYNKANDAPQVNAGPDLDLTLPDRATTLTGTATDDGLPAPPEVSVRWELVSPANAPVVFGSPTALQTAVSFDAAGTYVLRLSATDGALTASDDVVVNVQAGPPGSLPEVALTSPEDGSAVIAPTEVTGSVAGDSLLAWRLEYRPVEGTGWVRISGGDTPTSGVLGRFDPTLVLNGLYELRLVATNEASQSVATSVMVVVKENQKIGAFSVSFVDVEVPVAGLPMRVTRTYDSRDKRKGDFGYGWRLDLSNVKIGEAGAAGLGWAGSVLPGYFNQYCVTASRTHVVTVTTPDGEVYEFNGGLSSACQTFIPPQEGTFVFQPRPGTNATLTPLGNAGVILMGSWPGTDMQMFDAVTYDVFDPQDYVLTLPDGRSFQVHDRNGLQKIRDLNGNSLTVSANGIQHSSGKGLVFQRDAQGRIRTIVDPAGKPLTYTFDAAGDLREFKDREENTTKFGYLFEVPHHLETIEDPLGRTPIRNEYFPDGRIKSHTDAAGKTITYTHDVVGRQEIVVDRLGKQRVLEYDERGNVLKETGPDGKLVRRTFDARNNRLTETEPHDPLVTPNPPQTTYTYDDADNVLTVKDANNHTTTYTYNARRQVLTTKDARDKVTENVYDPVKGNLLSTKDALGNVTTYTYDAQGSVKTQTVRVDGVDQVTRYDYDSVGNLLKETDAAGHATEYTYDANGNRKTQKTTRTLPSAVVETINTTYDYDAMGRLTRATDTDGTFTRTVYDALGRQLETYDKLNRKTSYTYDDRGRLTVTTYPDNTTEKSSYDDEGRRLSSTDRANRTTSYVYDDVGRLTKTTYPDLTFTENKYDDAGRLKETVDARGKSTFYEYDAAGRRTKVKNPLGHETIFTYDANGNQETVRDAKLQTTTFTYDDLNRRTRTVFPDTTYTETGYDSLGRRISERDQAGRVTQFRYDAVGRLVKVIDARLKETTYNYDELGNRTSQTDANLHTTRFEYDSFGRETKRILPDEKFETKEYDDAGSLIARTDFMGRRITYEYQPTTRRLKARHYPAGTLPDVNFTHTVTGRRETVIDGRGTTTYGYDVRDRLQSLTYPDGRKLEYEYDARGNRTLLRATVAGRVLDTTFSYDDASRLDVVTDPANNTYDHGYDNNGNRQNLVYSNGTRTDYTYDTLNRLKTLNTTRPAGGTTIQGYTFTLGPSGNRERIDEADGTSRAYGYDELYRLTSEIVTINNLGQYGKTFTYDDVGNRLTQVTTGSGAAGTPTAPGTIDYDYDNRDRLLSETLAPNPPSNSTYDDNGNLSAKVGADTYTWDIENRLAKVVKGDSTTVEYVYDVDGVRVSTTTTPAGGSASTTSYLVDTSGGLSHVVAETNTAGALQAVYVRGDDLIGINRPTGPTTWSSRFVHADGIGSIRRLTDETGNITDGYTHTAFGELLAHTGTDPQPYAFAGEPLDPNSRFQYHRARWMDPRLGRFMGLDPFRGLSGDPLSLHRYLYASGDPVSRLDPSGAMAMPQGLEIGQNAHRLISAFYATLGAQIDTGPRASGGIRGARWRTDIRFDRDAGIAGGTVLFPGTAGEVYEIKSARQARLGAARLDLDFYIAELRAAVPAISWREGTDIIPMPPAWPGILVHPSLKDYVMTVKLEAPGQIVYDFVPLPYDPEETLGEVFGEIVKAGLYIGAFSAILVQQIGLAIASGF